MTEDEHGRLIETANCSLRCPGCGLCCAGYRDPITADYAGVEEFEGNLKLERGGPSVSLRTGLVRREGDLWYRASTGGDSCPGYGRCCPPFDLRQRPEKGG